MGLNNYYNHYLVKLKLNVDFDYLIDCFTAHQHRKAIGAKKPLFCRIKIEWGIKVCKCGIK